MRGHYSLNRCSYMDGWKPASTNITSTVNNPYSVCFDYYLVGSELGSLLGVYI